MHPGLETGGILPSGKGKNMLLKLAWKNIWRNKKRTIIVAASVFFAVILATVMRSAQLGSYRYMIQSTAKMQTGYLQIQGKGFWDNRSLDKSFIASGSLLSGLKSIKGITSATPRLEAFALLSHDSVTKVASVIGIDPQKEKQMTELDKKLKSGGYLSRTDTGCLMGSGLARRLNMQVGDSLVLYGSGYHAQTAAAMVPVRGIIKLPLPQLDNAMIFLSLPQAQYIYSAPARLTSIPIMIADVDALQSIRTQVERLLNSRQTVMSWDEMIPEMKQSIAFDNASGIIMLGILYMVIGFGVFGVIMMMTAEREKEFGILNSVGMQKRRLMLVSFLESIMVAMLGLIAGLLGSWPITWYLSHNPIPISGNSAATYEQLGIEPILSFSNQPDIFAAQALLVFVIAMVCALYPLFFIHNMKPVSALRK